MPLYTYLCKGCGRKVELYRFVKNRNKGTKCHCGKVMRKVFSASRVEVFKPMIYEHICETPILVTSKKQLREECKIHNVTAARLM